MAYLIDSIASRYTYGEFSSSGTITIANGDAIKIFGILIGGDSTASGETLEILNGSTVVASFVLTNRSYIPFSIPWIADQGLSFTLTTTADVNVTVFHMHPGT